MYIFLPQQLFLPHDAYKFDVKLLYLFFHTYDISEKSTEF